jgi:hypothetical protein
VRSLYSVSEGVKLVLLAAIARFGADLILKSHYSAGSHKAQTGMCKEYILPAVHCMDQ